MKNYCSGCFLNFNGDVRWRYEGFEDELYHFMCLWQKWKLLLATLSEEEQAKLNLVAINEGKG